ncbi:MAG: universal stress protein [candidate division Zixibacteria bacterium]|nr:universal stress protein [candidate division Zixibacteria bacterium]
MNDHNETTSDKKEGRNSIYLVPLDGSPMAESALPAVEFLALHTGAKVILLHIIEENPPVSIHGEHHLTTAAEAEEYFKRIVSHLRELQITTDVHVHTAAEGNVARSIIEHAGEINPDLVIMCTHGSGGFKGFLFGSIAQQVLQRGRWPILLMPPVISGDKPLFKLRRILVPLDDIHHHQPAFELTLTIARAVKAEVHLALVIPNLTNLAGERGLTGKLLPRTTRAVLDLAAENAEDFLTDMVNKYKNEDFIIRAESLRGDTVPEVLELAERIEADLISITSHGRTGVNAFLSGSVGPRIVGRSKCAILIVRAGTE